MSWLTNLGSAAKGLVAVGAKFGTSLVSSGSKAIASTPEFLGNVVPKAATLVPFTVKQATQPVSNLTASISKTPSNPFTNTLKFVKSGFVGIGSQVGSAISRGPVIVSSPIKTVNAVNAATSFFDATTSAISSFGSLATTAKSTFNNVFGNSGSARDDSTGRIPNNLIFQIPSDLLKALGGQSGTPLSPAGYIDLGPSIQGPTAAQNAVNGLSLGATIPTNLIVIVVVIAIFTLILKKT